MYTGSRALARLAFAVLVGLLLYVPSITAAAEENVEDILNKSPLTTDKDRAIAFGGCDSDPYKALEKFNKGAQLRPVQSGNSFRNGIDSALACRVSKMLQFAEQQGCRATIGSKGGYRSPDLQRNMCGGGSTGCAAAGTSCHQYGLAVDISAPCLGWLKQIAPRFHLVKPPISGDPYHFQCEEHPRGSRRSCTGPCNGGLAITPDLSNVPPMSYGPGYSPSSGLANAMRNFLNPQPSPGPSTPSQALPQSQQFLQQAPPLGSQNTTPYTPGTCAPQFYCKDDIYYYRSSTCVDQVYQKCPAGCSSSSNTCASTSTSETLSAFDQIGLIAEPTTTDVGAVSDLLFELTIGGEDIATLQDETTQTRSLPPDNSYGAAPPISQQTFVSGDLRYSQAEYQPQLSALQRTLATMKDTLLRVLAYLRPFGRPTVESEYDEWAE